MKLSLQFKLRNRIRNYNNNFGSICIRNSIYFRANHRNFSLSHQALFQEKATILKGKGATTVDNRENPMLPPTLVPNRNLFKHSKATAQTCSIIGAPMAYGQPRAGTDSAPTLLRQAGLRPRLSSLGWSVEDLSDLSFDNTFAAAAPAVAVESAVSSTNSVYFDSSTDKIPKNSLLVGKATEKIASIVQATIEDEQKFPLILGGDHSIAIGSLAGVLAARPDTGVIWIDAHADLNTPFSSLSGNMHGMPLGMLVEGIMSPEERSPNILPGFEWLFPTGSAVSRFPILPSDSIVYVGLRDVDPAEQAFLRRFNICAYTMKDIDKHGIGKIMEMALSHLLGSDSNSRRPIHLSYDIDAIDPMLAPATGTSVRGGLNYHEAHYVAMAIAQTGNLASAEIVELNPHLSGANKTTELALEIITSIMGGCHRSIKDVAVSGTNKITNKIDYVTESAA